MKAHNIETIPGLIDWDAPIQDRLEDAYDALGRPVPEEIGAHTSKSVGEIMGIHQDNATRHLNRLVKEGRAQKQRLQGRNYFVYRRIGG